jgi:Rrf2 family transcriptional regulator, cysteine metabolism repressor
MNFSAKAEYGVRLMIELGRHKDGEAVSLKAIAEAENLPLAYLEHVVAQLKGAQLVVSSRGAHGGYRLARPAKEIDMAQVVTALEGQIAPMDCFGGDAARHVACSHEVDHGHGCATKLLWTRVQGGVLKALQKTTLEELVEFSNKEASPVG